MSQFENFKQAFRKDMFYEMNVTMRNLNPSAGSETARAPAPTANERKPAVRESASTPSAQDTRAGRPSHSEEMYIAPTVDFDRGQRARDRRMQFSEHEREYHHYGEAAAYRDHRPDAYDSRDDIDNNYYDRDAELDNFRRAQDAKRNAEDEAIRLDTRSKPPRRSIVNRAVQSLDDSTVAITVTRSQPPYDHIMLRKLDVLEFAQWSDKIVEYTNLHHISLPVPNLVSKDVRNFLISHQRSLNRANFSRITAPELFSLCIEHLRPRSKVEFLTKLDRCVIFQLRRKAAPTSSNFEAFYDALLLYQHDFVLIYDILAEKNEHNIPPCLNKEGGLIKLFVKKIEVGSYAESIVKGFGHQKFDDIHDFMERYFEIVKRHYKYSLCSKEIDEHFGGSSYFAQDCRNATPDF